MAPDAVQHDADVDFWDFVACAVCHLPFSPPDRGPPPVPFWITECGHVLCNSHLNPNQSCAKCGDRDIQLVPLQRNIDPPMSDWFRSLPHAIDSMANAVKFQQASLAALVRHYRSQCLQLSSTCDRLRNERRSLRKENEAQRRELHMYRSRGLAPDQPREPSARPNHNGKRPIVDVRSSNSSIKTNSSPRSIPTPVGPLRLTLPPGEHPSFSQPEPRELANTIDRPGSSRFAEQFAYRGQDSARVRPDEQHSRFTSAMAPPPLSGQGSRFKAAPSQAHLQAESSTFEPRQTTEEMGPPPAPQRPFSAALRTPSRMPTQTNRFMPISSHSRAKLPGSTGGETSTAAANAGRLVSGGNRVPFMPPQGSKGFG